MNYPKWAIRLDEMKINDTITIRMAKVFDDEESAKSCSSLTSKNEQELSCDLFEAKKVTSSEKEYNVDGTGCNGAVYKITQKG